MDYEQLEKEKTKLWQKNYMQRFFRCLTSEFSNKKKEDTHKMAEANKALHTSDGNKLCLSIL